LTDRHGLWALNSACYRLLLGCRSFFFHFSKLILIFEGLFSVVKLLLNLLGGYRLVLFRPHRLELLEILRGRVNFIWLLLAVFFFSDRKHWIGSGLLQFDWGFLRLVITDGHSFLHLFLFFLPFFLLLLYRLSCWRFLCLTERRLLLVL